MKLPNPYNDEFPVKAKSDGRRKATPRPVNLHDGEDFRCAMYGSLGFSTWFIMRHTRLTSSQVAYRLRKGSIRRTDFRNGRSMVAAAVLRRTQSIAIPALKRHLKEVMKAKDEG